MWLLLFSDGLGAYDEHLQGDALWIKERYNSEERAGVRMLSVEILELGRERRSHGFVLIVR